ncbi:antibiotic biosynthesis monooxygenase [Hymenobacter sp. YC55]|uniref:antibiotic biosynthesis monooxygenase n=1 Tax=Hymenobacter sp. YC55 TaxID=3034019 RepID=UPI0023F92FCC|nr:antibiotic biosynthesis monooxygenase [Hymenobacter sp. YC55]MDF7814015.1 hypothetical protein [Hymenobacter sp. YC55]
MTSPLVSSQAAAEVKWHVKPGAEQALIEVAQGTLLAASTFSGFTGGNLLRPAPDSTNGEWQLVLQFATPEQLRAWQTSALCRAWKARSDALTVGAARVERISGFEGWFVDPARVKKSGPPKWKIALVTLLGIYPLIMVVPKLLEPLIGAWPPWLGNLVVTSSVMGLMTWLIMPLLTKVFNSWLYAGAQASSSASDG